MKKDKLSQEEQKLKEEAWNILTNNPDDYPTFINNNKSFDKFLKIIQKKFNESKLKYNGHNGKNYCVIINKLSPVFEEIKNNKALEISKTNIVLLTKNNAKYIENEIKNDFNYIPFAKIIFEYYKGLYGIEGIKENKDNCLIAIIREIDRDNSTNVWRYGNAQSIKDVVAYITDPKNNFFKWLKQSDYALPDDIQKDNKGIYSLSSKICKYLHEYMYNKNTTGYNSTGYYINDKYIRHALLFYLDFYCTYLGDKESDKYKESLKNDKIITSSKVDKLCVAKIYEMLQELHRLSDKQADAMHTDKLTKNELDHIIWYCYKSFNT